MQNTYGNKNRKDKIYIPELETVPEGFHNTVTETLYAITGAASDQKYGRRRRPAGKKMILPLAAAL